MDIPIELDFSKSGNYNNNNNMYELTGVINHYGNKFGGHYTANVKINNKWYDMNDSSYRALRDDVNVITRDAYVLFYELKMD
jgi:ubiquitin carboxyl-terminal hydrolase 4/11/15